MLYAVLDTNVIVSALWTPDGNASAIMDLVLTDRVVPCFSQDIIKEYRTVLTRPKLAFKNSRIDAMISEITGRGILVTVQPSKIIMSDESDRKFYDTAKLCNAFLITGNVRHFPKDRFILNPRDFLKIYK